MRPGWWPVVALLCLGACSDTRPPQGPVDPIPRIPETQQRTITRTDFPRAWPFTVGTGTLGCVDGAVVFQAHGVIYALNGVASSRHFAAAEPVRLTQHRAASNPLARVTQARRMQVFAESSACSDAPFCRQRVRDVHTLSDAELKQIEAEGLERRWPPLSPKHVPLDPVIDAGRQLCPREVTARF